MNVLYLVNLEHDKGFGADIFYIGNLDKEAIK